MKYLKLSYLILILVLFSCIEKKKEPTSVKLDYNTVTKNEEIPEQVKAEENDQLKASEIEGIKIIIKLFQENDPEKIAEIIRFPLNREYPIPPIKNKAEFLQRFSEVFDAGLIDRIANSKLNQWSEMGWRGIMLDQGVIWLGNFDEIITAVNYQSDAEKKIKNDLISKEKENLHSSLKTYEQPVYRIKTKNYLIRIDNVKKDLYRYASWKIGAKESSKPDLIIENGKLEFQGSGGNHDIIFRKGNFNYDIYRGIIGEKDAPEITLEVKENGKTILKEDGVLLE